MGEIVLTVRDRIIVHLSGFSRYTDDFECPEDMCQSGISAAIGKSRAHITLELNRMKDAGLVYDRNAHIKGAKSKRKTYLLTSQGVARNTEINGYLDSMKIEVVEEDENRILSGTEATEYLRNKLNMPRISAVDAVLSSNGFLRMSASNCQIRTNKLNTPHLPIKPDNFLPRRELEEIIQMLNEDPPNTIMLLGIPGIGKTTLLSEMAWRTGMDGGVMYRRLYSFDSLQSVLRDMSDFLGNIGFGSLKRYLAHPTFFDLSEAGYHLAQCFAKKRIILLFDEFEQAPATLKPLFSMLMALVKDSGSGMVLASSVRSDIYSVKEISLEKSVREIRLKPLDPEGALKLLTGVPENDAGKILDAAGGHPLTLKLLACGMGSDNLASYVEGEMLGSDAELSKLCRFTAILRKPFNHEELELFGFSNASCIGRELAFEGQPGGGYLLHPAISAMTQAATGKRMLRELHARAAEFYIQDGADPHEALHHLVRANKIDDARKFILENEEALLSTGNIEELAAIMERINPGGCDSIRLKELAATIFDRAGRWDMALAMGLEIENGDGALSSKVAAQTLHANILAKTGKMNEALSVLDDIPELDNEPELTVRAQYSRASTLRKMGRCKDALKVCKKALNLSERSKEEMLHAQCLMEMAMILTAMGQQEKALEHLEIALNAFETQDSIPDQIRCSINLGMVLSSVERDRDAISVLEKAVKMSEESGLKRFKAHAMTNLTDLLNRMGEYARSAELADEAMHIFSKLGEPMMQIAAMMNLSRALTETGDRKRAISTVEEAVALLGGGELANAREEWLVECADMLRDLGQEKRAKKITHKTG